MTPEEFRQALAARGVELSDHQMQQFADYYEYLVAVNEHVNLTAITQKDEVRFSDSGIDRQRSSDRSLDALRRGSRCRVSVDSDENRISES